MDFDEFLSIMYFKIFYVFYNKLLCLCYLYLFVRCLNFVFFMENLYLFLLNDKVKLLKLDFKLFYFFLNKMIFWIFLEKLVWIWICLYNSLNIFNYIL